MEKKTLEQQLEPGEETGVTYAEYLGEVPEWLTYDFPSQVKAKLTSLWGTEWNGQAQKWFLFKFVGNETEINLLGDGSENPEFSEWKWVPVEEVIKKCCGIQEKSVRTGFQTSDEADEVIMRLRIRSLLETW